jgi:hypothetical protein
MDLGLGCVSQYKNCVKGIPCGNTCIAKGKNCKPKPNAKANAVANLLANPDNLEEGADKIEPLLNDPFFDDFGVGDPPAEYKEWKFAQEPESNETLAEKLNPEAPPPTEDQAKAINTYTGSMYRDINGLLRGKKDFADPEYKQKVQDIADKAAEGLRSLPDYKGETYRGTALNDDIVAKMKVGGTYSDKGFLSSSSNPNIADNFSSSNSAGKTQVFFTINGKHGKDISSASEFENEKEILFNPSSKFKITSMEEKDGILRVGMKQYGKQK